GKNGNICYEIIKIIADKTMELKSVDSVTNDEVKGAIDYFFFALREFRGPYFLQKFTIANLYSNAIQVFIKINNKENGNEQITKPAYQSQSDRIAESI